MEGHSENMPKTDDKTSPNPSNVTVTFVIPQK